MTEQHNPLLEPVVINVLTKYVPMIRWGTFRLVCKPWHDELLPLWRKKMNVCIGGMGKNKLPKNEDDNELFMEVLLFLDSYQSNDVRQLEKFPIRSVKTIASEATVGGRRRDIQIQDRFWTLCGPWLHHLHLHGVMFKNVEMFKNVIFQLTPNLHQLEFTECDISERMIGEAEGNDPKALSSYTPGGDVHSNLKILKISMQPNPDGTFPGTFPLSLLSLFSVFVNVEEIKLNHFSEVDLDDDFIEYFFDVLKTIRGANQTSVLNVKKLDLKYLDLYFTPDGVTKLCTLSLPLEELRIPIDYIETSLEQILVKYSALKTLALLNFNKRSLNEYTCQLNVLPQTLTELELEGIVFNNWSFLAYTPNLTTLKVRYFEFQDRISFPKKFPGDILPCLQFLTTLSYDGGKVALNGSVETFIKIMPNVTKLTLSVDCTSFKTVCDAWPLLTYWEITYAKKLKEATFIANIHKLPNLTCLKVNVMNEEDDGREIMKGFGNDSIKNGFLVMPKLEQLCITLPHGITEKLLKDLYKKVEDTMKVFVVRNSEQLEKDPLVNIAGNGRKKTVLIKREGRR